MTSDLAVPLSSVVAAVLGNVIEFYDFTVYAFFAVFIGRAFFPTGDPHASLLLSVATFGIGFVTRPHWGRRSSGRFPIDGDGGRGCFSPSR